MPEGVGAVVMLPVGEGVMGACVAPGAVGELVPFSSREDELTYEHQYNIFLEIVFVH